MLIFLKDSWIVFLKKLAAIAANCFRALTMSCAQWIFKTSIACHREVNIWHGKGILKKRRIFILKEGSLRFQWVINTFKKESENNQSHCQGTGHTH